MPCELCSSNWRLRKRRQGCGSWHVFLLGREMSSARRHYRGRFLSQELQASLRDASRFPPFSPALEAPGYYQTPPPGRKPAIAFRRIRMNLVLTHTLKPSPIRTAYEGRSSRARNFFQKARNPATITQLFCRTTVRFRAFESQTRGPTSRLVRSESEKRPNQGGRCRCFHDVRCRGQANELYGGKILPR